MDSSSQAFRPAKTEETVSHHQKNRCYGGGDLASARQLVYSASCSFNCCAEQGHSVRTTNCGGTAHQQNNLSSCESPAPYLLLQTVHGLWARPSSSASSSECVFLRPQKGKKSETRMTANVPKRRSKKIKDSKERYLLGQKRNLQIFGVMPFVKLQNDT